LAETKYKNCNLITRKMCTGLEWEEASNPKLEKQRSFFSSFLALQALPRKSNFQYYFICSLIYFFLRTIIALSHSEDGVDVRSCLTSLASLRDSGLSRWNSRSSIVSSSRQHVGIVWGAGRKAVGKKNSKTVGHFEVLQLRTHGGQSTPNSCSFAIECINCAQIGRRSAAKGGPSLRKVARCCLWNQNVYISSRNCTQWATTKNLIIIIYLMCSPFHCSSPGYFCHDWKL